MKHGYRMRAGVRSAELAAALGMLCAASLLFASVGLALNPERHYELVSPVYKGGFGANRIEAVAPNGESVAYYSEGAFAEALSGSSGFIAYLARRDASGWVTVPVTLPASLGTEDEVDISPSLETVLQAAFPGVSYENHSEYTLNFYLHQIGLPDTPSAWESFASVTATNGQASETSEPRVLGADPDFCHIIFRPSVPKEHYVSQAVGAEGLLLYELTRGCKGEKASVNLVSVDNEDKPIQLRCDSEFGVGSFGVNGYRNTFNAVSADGGEIFFTSGFDSTGCTSSSVPEKPLLPHQLYVRLGGSRTVEVSRPLTGEKAVSQTCAEVPCEEAEVRGSAEFQGASEDGARVYFTAPLKTGQTPLVPGNLDSSNNLYMATIGCPTTKPACQAGEREVLSLSDVSHDPNGGMASVQGVLRVAPNGERAYFVAAGDLLSTSRQHALEAMGQPVPMVGAENLYVYTANGSEIEFIGTLCSGRELSGSVEDQRCPGGESDASLWSSDASQSQTAGVDGRFLVFATVAQLTKDDTNAARDVYRYDARTDELERVSIGEGGFDANGNSGQNGSSINPGNYGAAAETSPVRDQYELNKRAISEDGAMIVFVSADPLSPKATNGRANVYEWHENPNGDGGSVSLVTSGSGELPVEDAVISANGQSIVFDTAEGLVPQDTDGASDVYDARLGSGFAQSAAERRPCEGDACQGPLTNPAPLLVPGSASQAAGENFLPASSPATAGKAHPRKTKRASKACHRGRKKARGCARVKQAKRGGR